MKIWHSPELQNEHHTPYQQLDVSGSFYGGMAQHDLGHGGFLFRAMLSLDPATVTQRRYPELFQTGETAFGKPIVDGQHPHDLFMELAFQYAHPVGEKTILSLYFAPVGDPALGPVAFPHRLSAAEIPRQRSAITCKIRLTSPMRSSLPV